MKIQKIKVTKTKERVEDLFHKNVWFGYCIKHSNERFQVKARSKKRALQGKCNVLFKADGSAENANCHGGNYPEFILAQNDNGKWSVIKTGRTCACGAGCSGTTPSNDIDWDKFVLVPPEQFAEIDREITLLYQQREVVASKIRKAAEAEYPELEFFGCNI